MDLLTLQAQHVRDRPPRINKLSGLLDKLWRYVEKFEDLERKLRVSPVLSVLLFLLLTAVVQIVHDSIRMLHLHSRLLHSRETATAEVTAERVRRRAFSDAHTQARDYRREVRAEIRRMRDEAWIGRDVRAQLGMQRADALGDSFAV